MTGWFTVRRFMTVVVLVLAWCALWGEVSAANVLSGTVVAVAVSLSGLGTAGRGGVRLRPLARFIGLVAVDLVISTVLVAREILTPTDSTDEAIIAVQVPSDTRSHLLLLIVAVTVTPGPPSSTPIPTAGSSTCICSTLIAATATAAHVQELAALACLALPTRSVDQPTPEVRP